MKAAVELVTVESIVVVAESHPSPVIAPPMEGVITVELEVNATLPFT